MTDQIVLRQFQQLPDSLKQEVLDFIGYLWSKHLMATQKSLFSPVLVADKPKPAFGCGAIKIKIADDFDAPLDDFKEYMQ
jgi:Protein of unknown function (DUF2281)